MSRPDPRTPPLDVALSRSVLAACRADPEMARAINGMLLRAARRLRAADADGARLTVAGRRENLVLDLLLTAPGGCLVERARRPAPEDAPDVEV